MRPRGSFGRVNSKVSGMKSLVVGIVLTIFGILIATLSKSFTPLIIALLGVIGIIYGIYRITTSPNII
jgi:heme O synthase-like polyprenyltransferase